MTKDDIARSVWKYTMMETAMLQRYAFHIHPMKMEDLNREEQLARMLDWLDFGIPQEDYVLTPVHNHTHAECSLKTIDPERSIRPSFMDKLPDNMKLHPPSDVSED
jgi:hypothetical protein